MNEGLTAGLIGVSQSDLGLEYDYCGPYNDSLYGQLFDYITTLGITRAITGAGQGAETIWAWVAMEIPLDLTCLLSCQNYGNFWQPADREKLQLIKISSKVLTLGSGHEAPVKDQHRDKILIDRSDIVFIVVPDIDPLPSRYKIAIEYAKHADKEIILIKANELV